MPISQEEKEFAEHVVDLSLCIGPVYSKRMFGGFGIFLEGLMFGLIADNVYYIKVDGSLYSQKSHLVIPYSLDVNDMRFASAQGFNSGEQFYCYLKDAFDTLYLEGETNPKLMSIGLHCRIIGRPARFSSLVKFINYIQQFDDIWVCTREDIANHWLKNHIPV